MKKQMNRYQPKPFQPEKATPSGIPFGRYKDKPLEEIPDAYLAWLINNKGSNRWLKQAAIDELRTRGKFINPNEIISAIEQEIERRICRDDSMDSDLVGRITDHVMEAFDVIREKYELHEEEPKPAHRLCK